MTAGSEIRLTTFFLNNQEYGVDVMKVREITSMVPITRIANAPAHVKGVIDLRGVVLPVISLRSHFCIPELFDDQDCLIAVMDYNNALTGFIVDEISDVIKIRTAEIEPPPPAGASLPCVEGIYQTPDGRIITVLNFESLV